MKLIAQIILTLIVVAALGPGFILMMIVIWILIYFASRED